MNHNSQYQKDFYAWALNNAKLLRQGKFKEIDVEHIAEEMESMGRKEERELERRLEILIMHLLKWQFQVYNRTTSWEATIKEQRRRIKRLLEESPSLKPKLPSQFDYAYETAVIMASAETNIPEKDFPKKSPFKLEECLSDNFFPE